MKKLILIFIALCGISQVAYSRQDSSCSDTRSDIAVMIQVSDYKAMLKASDWAIKNCKEDAQRYTSVPNLSDMESYYNFYGTKAEAYIGLGKFEEALKTSQECIDLRYNTVDCQLTKWKSLMRLKRYDEAIIQKKNLYLIIENKIRLVNQADISGHPRELQNALKDLRRSELEKLDAYKYFLDKTN
jgi:tetratricopeptide (TPR) repeat protein